MLRCCCRSTKTDLNSLNRRKIHILSVRCYGRIMESLEDIRSRKVPVIFLTGPVSDIEDSLRLRKSACGVADTMAVHILDAESHSVDAERDEIISGCDAMIGFGRSGSWSKRYHNDLISSDQNDMPLGIWSTGKDLHMNSDIESVDPDVVEDGFRDCVNSLLREI